MSNRSLVVALLFVLALVGCAPSVASTVDAFVSFDAGSSPDGGAPEDGGAQADGGRDASATDAAARDAARTDDGGRDASALVDAALEEDAATEPPDAASTEDAASPVIVFALGAPGNDCNATCGGLGRVCAGLATVGLDCAVHADVPECSVPGNWIYRNHPGEPPTCRADWGTSEVCGNNYNGSNSFCCACRR